jgi:hypothetical protein
MVLLLFIAAMSQAPADHVAQFSSYVRGERWDFRVTQADLDRAPVWREIDSAPPLPPRDALAAARKRLSELVADSERWRRDEIVLKPLVGGWVYVVNFFPPQTDPLGGATQTIGLVVLLDGRAIVPTRTPWPRR